MKIVTTQLHPRYLGLQLAASKVLDHENIIMWQPNSTPIFDVLDEIKPDVVFCDIKFVNSTFMRAFSEYSHVKTVLFNEAVPHDLVPDAVVAKPSTSPVIRKHIESDKWNTVYCKDSADICSYWGGQVEENLACDIGYLSVGTDPEKLKNKMIWISEILKKDPGVLRVLGSARMPLPQYLGTIKENKVSSFLKSAKIILDYDEDVMLNGAANGACVFSTVPNRLFPSVDSSSIEGLLKGKKRDKIARKAQKLVLAQDTCYHRFAEVMEAIGAKDEAQEALKQLEELTCEQV